jgi:hypothetical protein
MMRLAQIGLSLAAPSRAMVSKSTRPSARRGLRDTPKVAIPEAKAKREKISFC